ncbi:MAG: Gfo/Idh/MocA family oxidoreductase [Patescibacteria group bacterium]
MRFGIIGVGYFGKHYVRLLQEIKDVELVGIAARSVADMPELPETIKKYESADTLLCDLTIDCVIIATPPSSHARLVIGALEKGKHVLVEKPMALSVLEAQAIADAADKSGRTCMIGHQYCYNDYIRALKKEIEKKTIGDIKYIFAEHIYPGPVRLDIGCFWETATHELAIIDYLFGNINAVKITGQMVDIGGSGHDDAASVTIAFDNGMLASIVTSWFVPQKVRRMIIAGTKGTAVFDEKETHPLVLFKHEYPQQESPELHTSHFFEITEKEKYIPHVDAHEPLHNELRYFIDCIIKKKTPITGVEHGLRVTKLLDEITRASL